MKKGHLSQYFSAIAAKRLSAVEADAGRSNQHEFNGSRELKRLFGTGPERKAFSTRFIYLCDHDDEAVIAEGSLTWYDARERHPTRSEHRLYFPTTQVSMCAAEGDLLVIGRRPDDTILVVIAENGSTICSQIEWLFGLSDMPHPGFSIRSELENDQDRIAYASRCILENIGVAVETPPDTFLDSMLARFDSVFPSTRAFSEYARSTVSDVDLTENADAALMIWMDREEILFRTLEKHLISERLRKGFEVNVDEFISFSLSVQNRRKSRAGYALENHLEFILCTKNIRYDRNAITENRTKPDFLFPGVLEYHNPDFPVGKLSMLGVKSTCKDRWRQVLSEANRVPDKHLLTLEPAISINQTDEMKANNLHLVVPEQLHVTYKDSQRKWLMNVSEFTSLVQRRQASA